MEQDIKQKKQDLGIFYTDQRIVNFIYDILFIWKEREEKETGRWESKGHYPSVIDPAVGEGVFLKTALERGFTQPKYVFGVDLDEEVKDKWVQINLLKSFGSRADLDKHFFHQNGLLPLNEEQRLRYKKDGLNTFDAVVGNPPYGGIGLANTKLTDELVAHLSGFKVLPTQVNQYLKIDDMFTFGDVVHVHPEARQRLQSFSIEVLFIERFLQLAKPEGWIAIIIPDGILCNSNAHYVRQFIVENAKVEAIVSLPRDAFKHVGTSAKTSILFLKKSKDNEKITDYDYPVFLSSIERLDEKGFKIISDRYKEFYYGDTKR